jgi:EamA-like transporter family
MGASLCGPLLAVLLAEGPGTTVPGPFVLVHAGDDVAVGLEREGDTGVAQAFADHLGVLSTGVAYVLNYRLIQDEGPTAASMTNYLTPVVAVLLGIAFVDERLTWNLIIGTAMILIGLWIAEHDSDERKVASDILKLSEDGARGCT